MSMRNKLLMLVGIALSGLVLLSSLSLYELRQSLLADRMEKTRNLVEMAVSVTGYYEREAQEGRLETADAQRLAKNALTRLRYDGDEYFFVLDQELTYVAHGFKQALVGKSAFGVSTPDGEDVGQLLRGDLGFSLQYQIPVSQLLNQYIWNSFLLASVALVFYWGIGLAVGVVSALRPGSWFDHLVSVAVFAAMSFPTFFLCLLLIKWFAVDLHWLPVGGMTNTGSDESGWQYVLQVAAHLALPVLALVMLQAGSLTRYVRASMLDVVKMDFIRTARAKGLQERTVILKHALRNALLPIITLLGFELPGLFSGAIITEKVFNWPGAGHIHIDSLAARDYPVLMGFTLFLAALTILGNLIADILYAWADPRIRVRS